MARDLKYGKIITEYGTFSDESEPVFLLRGKDVLALEALLHYREQAERFGCTTTFCDQVQIALERFAEWSGSRKLPD